MSEAIEHGDSQLVTDLGAMRDLKLVVNGDYTEFLSEHPVEDCFAVDENGNIYVSSAMSKGGYGRTGVLARQLRLLTEQRGLGKYMPVQHSVFTSHIAEVLAEQQEAAAEGGKASVSAQEVLDILYQAIDSNASDIHIEVKPGRENKSPLQFRVDGLLTHQSYLSATVSARIVRVLFNSHDFARGDLKTGDACDEMFEVRHPKRGLHTVRLNSIPTEGGGNKLVARIRNPHEIKRIQDSGYTRRQVEKISAVRNFSAGMFLFCGPTNSGKSTSVTSIMSSIARTKCVLELADPIEATLPNVTHVNIGGDYDAHGLALIEATVRQDTDVLVLGEIRDKETVSAAEQMAEQGKLVISTLHTESVVGVHSRLVGIGMKKELLSLPNFLRGAVAQKLVPMLCQRCASEIPSVQYGDMGGDPHKQALDNHRHIAMLYKRLTGDSPKIRYWNPKGCRYCRNGIRGRTVVAEVMMVDGQVREIFADGNLNQLRQYLMKEQMMTTIQHHALLKIGSGFIDPEIVQERTEMITDADICWPARAPRA